MHGLNNFLSKRGDYWSEFAYRFIPFYRLPKSNIYMLPHKETIELEKMITFDALTPKFDSPMSTRELKRILSEEGFQIEYLEDGLTSPVYATARKK
jgi:hypothetical protein